MLVLSDQQTIIQRAPTASEFTFVIFLSSVPVHGEAESVYVHLSASMTSFLLENLNVSALLKFVKVLKVKGCGLERTEGQMKTRIA